MLSFPWTATFVEQIGSIQILIESKNGKMVSMMEFYNIDDAMVFLNPFNQEHLRIANPKWLRVLIEAGSKIPYAFTSNDRINRKVTIENCMLAGIDSVRVISRMTGFERQMIHEAVSRLRAEHNGTESSLN